MNITKVNVKKVNTNNRMKAVASIVIDDCFVVNEIKVLESEKGLFIGMPSWKDKEGKFKDIAHPINAETREMIQKAVLSAYNKLGGEENVN